ncbi:cupin domain-containing protein [Mucilaginibacter koreensis]
MISSALFQEGVQTQWQDAAPGIQRQLLGYDEKLMLVKVKLEAGSVGRMHSHPHSQSTYVESGVFEITIGEAKKVIRAGDGYYVPPYTEHECTCIEPGVLIDSFSPCRWDFLSSDHNQFTL